MVCKKDMNKQHRNVFFTLNLIVGPMVLAATLVSSCLTADGESTVSVFSKYETTVVSKKLSLAGTFNPYDADSVRVDAIVILPSGKQTTVPCFWYIPCKQLFVKKQAEKKGTLTDWERFQTIGEGKWCFRFCPTVEGEYKYSFAVSCEDKSWTSKGGLFHAVRGRNTPPGFIKLRPDSKYFQYQNGRSFIPVGENLGWPEESGSRGYETWLKSLHAAKANCARLWLVHYFSGTALEWSSSKVNAGYRGVGNFSQESAARVDRILQAAVEQEIYLILSFFSFGDTNWDWEENPYSRKAGGWLSHPLEFFVDIKARKAIKNRLRYAAARYGWCPNIWAWELWNEVETSQGFQSRTVSEWHKEMAEHLKRVDTNRHLITTSYRFTPPATDCLAYKLNAIDFIQVHSYLPEITAVFPRRLHTLAKYGKPVVIAEYGLYVSPNYFDADPAGLHIHDGLWAGIFSGSPGGGMTWWWERYVHPRDLYFHFTGISRFLQEVKFEEAQPCNILLKPAEQKYFAFALKTKNKILAWIGPRRQVMWKDVIYKQKVLGYSSGPIGQKPKIILEGTSGGKYTVVFFDTFDGVPLGSVELSATEKGLIVPVPDFRHDIALVAYIETSREPVMSQKKAATPIHDRFEQLVETYKK